MKIEPKRLSIKATCLFPLISNGVINFNWFSVITFTAHNKDFAIQYSNATSKTRYGETFDIRPLVLVRRISEINKFWRNFWIKWNCKTNFVMLSVNQSRPTQLKSPHAIMQAQTIEWRNGFPIRVWIFINQKRTRFYAWWLKFWLLLLGGGVVGLLREPFRILISSSFII